MAASILDEDWSDYDLKKPPGTRFSFACDQDWEVGYLVKKIKLRYPEFPSPRILAAIKECCRMVSAPRSRSVFVGWVLRKLGK